MQLFDKKIKFHGQFKMNYFVQFFTAINNVEFSQCSAFFPHRKIVGEQFGLWIVDEKEVPKAFKYQPQSRAGAARRQIFTQRRVVFIQLL